MPCDECRGHWSVFGKRPPCKECWPGELNERNRDAMAVLNICFDQVVSGGMEPVGIMNLAIEHAMDRVGVQDRDATFFKVRAAAREIMRMRREANESS